MTITPMRLPAGDDAPARQRADAVAQSDEQLGRQLMAKPVLLSELQNQAQALYQKARLIPGIRAQIDHMWTDYQMRSVRADRSFGANNTMTPRVATARVALEAAAFFSDLLSLPLSSNHPLQTLGYNADPNVIADTPEARALLMSRPSTAAWLRHRDEERAIAEERRIEGLELARRDAPATFLKMMRARGIDIQLNKLGALIVPPGTDMTKVLPSELSTFKDWKPELVAILKAEAEVAKVTRADEPTVLA